MVFIGVDMNLNHKCVHLSEGKKLIDVQIPFGIHFNSLYIICIGYLLNTNQ